MQLGARRFVAGERAEEFLTVAKQLNARGFAVACGILGEGVRHPGEAKARRSAYCEVLRAFAHGGYDANVAFKLTHIGLDIDPELAYENAARIAETAADCSKAPSESYGAIALRSTPRSRCTGGCANASATLGSFCSRTFTGAPGIWLLRNH